MSRLLAWLLAAFVSNFSLAQVTPGALPTGGKVVVGSGQLQVSPNLLVVQQNTSRLGLDWQSFNIGSNAMVEFRQPGADSVALNRVLGNSGSEIYGRLKANGQVFLSNPNGVLFAPGAKVDVGGLVATTLDLSQQDFAASRYIFGDAGAGAVVNQGSLQAASGGYLALLGERVDNRGEMTVDTGSVVLASGRAATVSISGHGLISAVVTPGSVSGSVGNSGSIVADGGTVRLTAHSAQQIAASLVNNSGIVRANTLVERAGEIWITGDNVATSGSVQANAPAGGNAGRIMVIGDLQRGRADVAGTLEARATAPGAAGGFIETSAARVKVADGTRVNTLGAAGGAGAAGTWLIDPVDYTVAASGGDITGATLSANLGGGNVTILSSQGSAGTAGNVNINDSVSWSANKLTLNAFADIRINAALNGSGSATLALEYGQGAVAAGNTASYGVAAPVTLPAGASFSTKLGSNGATEAFTVVTTLSDLQAIDGNSTVLAGRYALGADIDASSTASANGGLGFDPIGNEAGGSTAFTGRFDGLGHTISGLTINRPAAEYVGLFAWTRDAAVRHLRLTGGAITGQGHVGAVTGYADGASTFTAISSAVPVTASRASGTVYAGGLVGLMTGNTSSGVFASSSSGAVSGSSASGGGYAGGLVARQDNGQLVDGTASGSVTLSYTGASAQVSGHAGGLAGMFASPAGIVRGSASGTVNGNYDAGGLVGYYASAGAVTGSQASGNVSGSESVGGLIGYFAGGGALSNSSATGHVTASMGAAGGLVGYVAHSAGLSDVQASGNVTSATNEAGGLVGQHSSGSISNASASGRVSGASHAGGLVGQMQGGGTLATVSASGDASAGSTSAYAGGLVGQMSGGAITGATATGKVSSGYTAGGLAGYVSSTSVSNASASGDVSAVGNSTVYVGGLIGYQSSNHAISGTASGNVFADATGTYAGGLIGYSDGAPISGSTASGNVTGRDSTNASTSSHYTGGLVGHFGYYYNQSIASSSASGNVSGRYHTGGLVGYFYGQQITGSSATGAVTGGRYVGGLVGIGYATALSHLSATGSVSSSHSSASVGGLFGYASTSGALSDLSASGQVTASGSSADAVGGLFGELHFNGGGLLNAFASGHVTITAINSGQAGGLIGYASSSSSSGTGINDSAATGNVNGGQYAGGLVGNLSNSYGYGGIANSHASGDVTGGDRAGGLVGYHFRSQPGGADDIANSHASGDVSGLQYVGGLVGQMYAHNGIVGSYATGSVTGRGSNSTTYLGGLAGSYYGYHASAQAPALLRESFATGNVALADGAQLGTSTTVYAGGLVGHLDGAVAAATPLSNVYATGSVLLDNPRGRLNAGGLVGYSDDQKIEFAYARGAVAALNGNTRAAGGLLAARGNSNASVASSYWDSTASGQATSLGGGTALSAAQMQQSANFAGFDIATTGSAGRIWRIYEGFTAPLLTRLLTPLSLTLSDASKAYDGTRSFGSANLGAGVLAERVFTSVGTPDVGVYAVSAANVYSQQTGYDLSVSGSANLTITPRPLSLDGVFADKVYDGTRSASLVANAQPAGLVDGEDLTLNSGAMNAAFDTRHVGQNKAIAVSGLTLADGTRGKAANYSLAGAAAGAASITPKALNVGGLAAVDRNYDGSTTVAITSTPGTMTGAVAGDEVQASLAGVTGGTMADKHVGTDKVVNVQGATLTGSDAGNYVIAGIDAVTVDIAPRALSINGLVAANRSYNATVNVSVSGTGATLQGAVAGDNVQLGDTSLTGTMADKHAQNGKLVTVDSNVLKLRGADAGNYTVQAATTTVDIAKYQTHIEAYRTNSTDKVYDGSTSAAVGLRFWSVYGNDDVGFSNAAPAYADRHVAYLNGNVTSKAINVANIELTGSDKDNYQLTSTTASTSGTISPRPLVVSGVAAVDRAYDGTLNVTVNVGGASVDTSAVVAGDNVSVALPGAGSVVGTVASRHVGNNKAVAVPGFSLGGSEAGNYTLGGSAAGVTVNITRKTVNPVYTADDKVYDGNVRARIIGSSTDIVAGDDVAFESAYWSQFYDNYARFTGTGAKDVGSGKTVQIVYDALNGSHAGNYLLNYSGATASASITPKGINAAFIGVDKVYDGSDAASVTLHRGSTGIVGSDAVTTAQTAVFSAGKAAGNNKAIAVTGITLGGADAGNYALNSTTAAATADITPKAVTVSGISATNRVYDGSNVVALTSGTLGAQGFVAGDTVAVQPPAGGISSGTMVDKLVGSAKPVTVTGLTLSGADAGNYVIDSAASGITVDIARRPLVAAYAGVNRSYTGGVTVDVNASSADLIANDVVTFSQSAIFTGLNAADVGTAKPIAVSNIVLGGADAPNYALQNTTASATADVSKKGLTVTYTGGSRVYNGLADTTAPVSGRPLGIVPGDTVSIGQSALFTGNGAVGNNKPVAVTGITLGGADAGNYQLASPTASTTASITRRPIGVVGVSATSRIYDGTRDVAVNTAGAVIDASTVVGADQGQVDAVLPAGGITTGLLDTKDAGNNRNVTITGITLTGAMASNYQIIGATGLVVNIAPRSLTASYSAADKVYDGNAVAQVAGSSVDVLAADAAGLGFSASGLFTAGKNAGNDKTVAVSGGFLTGAERNNYVLLNPTGSSSADITPKNLTPGYAGGTRVYDGGVTAPVVAQTAGIVGGDNVGFTQTAVFTGAGAKNVANGKPVQVSDIALAGTDAGNYRLTATTAATSASVTPKPISIDGLTGASATDRTYDGTRSVTVTVTTSGALSPSSADIVSGDVVTIALPAGGITTGTMADKHAGDNKAVVVDGLSLSGADAGNYSVAATSGVTVDIARKSLTAGYRGNDKVYDGSAVASASGTSADIVSGDVVSIVGGGVFTGSGAKNVGNDKAVAVSGGHLSGADARNYTLLNTTGSTTADITPRTVTASYTGQDKIYDGTTTANVSGSAGFIAGDSVTLSQTAVFTGAGARNAGANKTVAVSGITLGGADAANYNLSATSAGTTASITPKALRILGLTGVSAVDRVYDGTRSVVVNVASTGPISVNAADVISGDDVAVNAPATGTTTGLIADKNAGNNRPVAVNGLDLTGTHAANYSITATGGVTVNIARRDVTATYAGVAKVYDGSAAATVTGAASGLIAGDSVGIGGSAVYTGAGAKNVGVAKAVNVTVGALTGADAANYNLLNTTATTTADITPKMVSASYIGGTRVYDGSTAAPVAGTVAGFIDGDSVTLHESAVFTGAGAKNVGSAKAVAISGINLQGVDATNYGLTATSAASTASVTPKPLRIDGFTGVSAADRVYDGSNRVAVVVSTSGPVTPNAADLIAGDVVTVTAPAAGNTAGTMLDKNVGNNKPVAVAGLTLSGADAGNYSVATTSGVTVNIAPKPLTASYAVADKVYDGTAAASLSGSSADIVAGDTVVIGGTASFVDGKNVGNAKGVNVSDGALAGVDGGNYSLLNRTASLRASITPRPVDATYTGGTREYDGSAAAPITSTTTGLIAGDDIQLSQQALFEGAGAKNVGTGKAILVSGIALSGADAVNYTLIATAATTTGSITPRSLNVTGLSGLTAVDRVYDGTSAVQIVGSGSFSGGLSNIVAGDDVGVALPGGTLNAGTMGDKHAGQNKAVVVDGLALTGVDAANYAITGTAGLSVNIAPRALVVQGLTAIDRVYDGSTVVGIVSSAGSLGGVLPGDSVTLGASGVTAAIADKHVGQGKAVDLAGLTLSGADARNYTAGSPTAVTVNITPRALQAGATAADKVYDGNTTASVNFNDNRVAGDTLVLSATGSFADKNAGAAKPVAISGITLSGADAGNYQLAGTTANSTATIQRAPATVIANSLNKVYGETLALGGNEFTAPGLVAGETIGQVTLSSAGTAAGATVSGGPYSIGAQDARGGSFNINNYNLSYQSGQLVVVPRPVTVASNSLVRFADEPNPVTWGFSTSVGGLLGSDSIVSVVQAAPAGSVDAPGGSVFELLPSGAVFGSGDAGNYSLRYAGGLLVVLPKPPRIGDTTNAGGGGGDVGFAIQIDPDELKRALGELERAASLSTQIGAPVAGELPPLRSRVLQASADDIRVALSGDSRQISLPALLRLPLISFDPQLKRLIFGAPAAP